MQRSQRAGSAEAGRSRIGQARAAALLGTSADTGRAACSPAGRKRAIAITTAALVSFSIAVICLPGQPRTSRGSAAGAPPNGSPVLAGVVAPASRAMDAGVDRDARTASPPDPSASVGPAPSGDILAQAVMAARRAARPAETSETRRASTFEEAAAIVRRTAAGPDPGTAAINPFGADAWGAASSSFHQP